MGNRLAPTVTTSLINPLSGLWQQLYVTLCALTAAAAASPKKAQHENRLVDMEKLLQPPVGVVKDVVPAAARAMVPRIMFFQPGEVGCVPILSLIKKIVSISEPRYTMQEYR